MHQRGFLLFEVLITVGLLAMLLAILVPYQAESIRLERRAYELEMTKAHEKMARALVSWAEAFNGGRLPAPFSDASRFNFLVDPDTADADDKALVASLLATGVSSNGIGFDGRAGEFARVYQMVPNLTVTQPVNGLAGPLATLTFDIGLLYVSRCGPPTPECYPDAGTGIAGESPVFDTASFATWAVQGDDTGVYRFSTLDLQRSLLDVTTGRINRLRDALREFFRASFLSTAPDASVNYFPISTAGSLAGQDPALNEGCRDGWYSIAPTSVHANIVEQIGLSSAEFGVTAWGAPVEYCRDMDPAGTNGAGSPPHNAALRIHRSVSVPQAPGMAGMNLVWSL